MCIINKQEESGHGWHKTSCTIVYGKKKLINPFAWFMILRKNYQLTFLFKNSEHCKISIVEGSIIGPVINNQSIFKCLSDIQTARPFFIKYNSMNATDLDFVGSNSWKMHNVSLNVITFSKEDLVLIKMSLPAEANEFIMEKH